MTSEEIARGEVGKRIDEYFAGATAAELADTDGTIPLWLVIVQLFDNVQKEDIHADMIIKIRNRRVRGVQFDKMLMNPNHPASEYEELLKRIKQEL